MQVLVLAVGVLLTAVSLYFLAVPQHLGPSLQRIYHSRWLFAVALLRLLLGAGLIAAAPSVALSFWVELAGWVFALSGMALVVIPPQALRRLVSWYAGLSVSGRRLWLTLALLFGLFFLYAWWS